MWVVVWWLVCWLVCWTLFLDFLFARLIELAMPPLPGQPDPRQPDQAGRVGGGFGAGGAFGAAGGFGSAEAALRIEELLIDRATQGLDASQEAELELLLQQTGRTMDEGYEAVAAALDLALDPAPAAGYPKIPVQLRTRILAAGDAWLARQEAEAVSAGSSGLRLGRDGDEGSKRQRTEDGQTVLARIGVGSGWQRSRSGRFVRQNAGWLTAAACLLIAAAGWLRPTQVSAPPTIVATGGNPAVLGGGTTSVPTAPIEVATKPETTVQVADASQEFELLKADVSGEVRRISLAMTASAMQTITDPEAPLIDGPPAPAGELMWSTAKQRGVVRLSGLPKLRRPGDQYQLWLIDALRDEAHPIPAGVFDVESDGQELLVSLRAPVRVDHAVRVAITVERSGGSITPSSASTVVVGASEPVTMEDEPAESSKPVSTGMGG